MALANYTDLQTTIANWLKRTDLASQIPDFITVAESRLNRVLKLRVKEIEVSLPVTLGSRYSALPADYVEAIALWVDDGSGKQLLGQTLPQNIARDTESRRPVNWAVDGANIIYDAPIDQAYVITLRYVQSFALSSGQPTNWLLTNHPDVYLYASLLSAQEYIIGDGRIPIWQQELANAIQEINQKESRSRSATLRADAGITVRPYYGQDFWGE